MCIRITHVYLYFHVVYVDRYAHQIWIVTDKLEHG